MSRSKPRLAIVLIGASTSTLLGARAAMVERPAVSGQQPEPRAKPAPDDARGVVERAVQATDIAARYNKDRELIHALAERLTVASSRLASLAPEADRWLFMEPNVVVSEKRVWHQNEADAKDELAPAIVGEGIPAAQIEAWSMDLWRPALAKEQWRAFRQLDENGLARTLALTDTQQSHYDAAAKLEAEISKTTNDKPLDMGDVVVHPSLALQVERFRNHVNAIREWANTATDFVEQVSAFESGFAQALEHRRRATRLADGLRERSERGGDHSVLRRFPFAVYGVVAPGGGLGEDTAMTKRHRYAMSDREYIADNRVVTPTTWPVSDKLYEAAANYEFWYRWATSELWYKDSDRRLNPLEWPFDAARTRELHAEFSRVVVGEHAVFVPAFPRHAPDWTEPARFAPVPDRKKWLEELRRPHTAFEINLSSYFAAVDDLELPKANARIPPLVPPASNRLLPPQPK